MKVKLIMFRDDGSRRDFPLPAGETIIGRQEDCQIRIPLAVVSRQHAIVRVTKESAVLKDLGTANGTYLNNRRITDEEELEPGDQIIIGPVIFTVQIDSAPADDEIVPIRTKIPAKHSAAAPAVRTSRNVYMSDDEVDPISALEALASGADQTAIEPEEE